MKLTNILFKPKASEVLTAFLKQSGEPHWTSFFIKYADVENDQFGRSNFNWKLNSGTNYQILRTGCWPYVKYHCSKKQKENLILENALYTMVKIVNLGIPTFLYGLAATWLITHQEEVILNGYTIPIYFLMEEDKESPH